MVADCDIDELWEVVLRAIPYAIVVAMLTVAEGVNVSNSALLQRTRKGVRMRCALTVRSRIA